MKKKSSSFKDSFFRLYLFVPSEILCSGSYSMYPSDQIDEPGFESSELFDEPARVKLKEMSQELWQDSWVWSHFP
ncbi:hypothetical protein DY000_02043295 [Brassica cretica]|uniref:Uncharacterized protein n=1 Tax=Brassica cretica TaxID=69181 RepID=A0ABQ7BG31_BRACR|nr:hypothetical protein DY000_02043295 [Brassica cretica]